MQTVTTISLEADVPLEYGAEFPNPIPNHGTGGYPITLQFPPFDKVTGVSAKLTNATGNPVEFFLSDPEHPATSFACVQRAGRCDMERQTGYLDMELLDGFAARGRSVGRSRRRRRNKHREL